MNDVVAVWQRILIDPQKSWVLFRNGTVVIFNEPQDELSDAAIALMKEWGPVHAGSPAGDFSVINLQDSPGWVVTCHHNDILNYVSPEEFTEESPKSVAIGLLGRSKRNEDAHCLEVVHVEGAQG